MNFGRLAPEKRYMRKLIASRLAALAPAARAKADAALRARAEAITSPWLIGPDKTVLAYKPLRDEPDISALLLFWRRMGARLVFPDETAESPRFSDPSGVQAAAGAFILMPGRGFSLQGARLGRGGGWYDRWLGQQRQAPAIRLALAYDEQVFPSLPAGPTDQPITHLLTPTRFVAIPPP